MFSNTRIVSMTALAMTAMNGVSASHLDDTNGAFTNFVYDTVKFKTQTNCSLDKWPEVSANNEENL